MHKKIKEKINAVLFIFFLQNITQSIVPNIEKLAIIQQTVLEQPVVIVKYKFIKCKQSVGGSIISQILKLPTEMGIQWNGNNPIKTAIPTVYKFYQKQIRTIWHEILSVQ